MASFKDKLSLLIEKQAPEFVLSDHPKFLEFVKTYYTFMESAELAVTSVESTDGIRLETETAQENNLVLDASRLDTDRTQLDAGDKIILEDSSFNLHDYFICFQAPPAIFMIPVISTPGSFGSISLNAP